MWVATFDGLKKDSGVIKKPGKAKFCSLRCIASSKTLLSEVESSSLSSFGERRVHELFYSRTYAVLKCFSRYFYRLFAPQAQVIHNVLLLHTFQYFWKACYGGKNHENAKLRTACSSSL